MKILRKAAKKNPMVAKIIITLGYSVLYKRYREEIENAIMRYRPLESREGAQKHCNLRKDIIFSLIYYQMTPEEYFRYDFEALSDAGRYEYVSTRESDRIFYKNNSGAMDLERNKYGTYLKFKPYFGRKLIYIKSKDDWDVFANFVKKAGSVVIKPTNLSGGRGVHRFDYSDDFSLQQEFNTIMSNNSKTVVEELIHQSPLMAKFHEGSVNTVRVVTYLNNGKLRILAASVRMGMGDSFVDNGCLSSSVDWETGIITSLGRSAHSPGKYLLHPDTNVQILGNIIPMWKELQSLVYQLPYVYPEQKITGWDLALTDNGWIMIESNRQPEIQTLYATGVRKLLESIE